MSASVIVVAPLALFMAIGDDTHEIMKLSTWDMLGLCDINADNTQSCESVGARSEANESPQCVKRKAHGLPCDQGPIPQRYFRPDL